MPNLEIEFDPIKVSELVKKVEELAKAFSKVASSSTKAGTASASATAIVAKATTSKKQSPLTVFTVQQAQQAQQSGIPFRMSSVPKGKIPKVPALPKLPVPPPTFGSKLKSAFMSSRFGADGIMPLVNKVSALVGEAGTMAVAVGFASAKLVQSLHNLADASAKSTFAFNQFRTDIGSSAGTGSILRNLGGSIGLDKSNMGRLANSFQERITSDHVAMSVAGSRLGVQNMNGFFGDQDYGNQLLKAIHGLRGISNREERIRVARAVGLTDALPLLDISNRQLSKVQGDMFGGAGTANKRTSSADFISAQSRLSLAIENLVGSVGNVLAPTLTQIMNNLADNVNTLANAISTLSTLGDTTRLAFNLLTGDLKGSMEAYRDMQENQKRSTDKNTEALNRNTQMMKDGIYGIGGDRLSSALGDGSLGGEYLRRALLLGGF